LTFTRSDVESRHAGAVAPEGRRGSRVASPPSSTALLLQTNQNGAREASMRIARVVLTVAACAALTFTGCAKSRAQDRQKILAAENTDLRQRTGTLEGQLQGALSAQDRATVELQVQGSKLREAERQAALAAEAQQRASMAEQAAADAQRNLAAQAAENQRLQQEKAALAARSAPKPPSAVEYKESAEVEALRRDIADRLSRAGVDAPVEVRTSRSGERKVAVVLQDAYPSGSESLAKNPRAVEAVARLSQVLQKSYPGSRIHIEGHTDSDPIRRSNWPSNEALGLARADTVKKLLVQAGLSEGQVQTEGVGARNPIAKGGTPRAKAANRRVEIYVSPR
jgi:flagellar motor protein MotB